MYMVTNRIETMFWSWVFLSLTRVTMNLPCREDGVTLTAGLTDWEAVLRLPVNP